MKIIYFDCFAGAAGDMLLGSLLELGVDSEELEKALKTMEIGTFQLHTSRVQKNGLAGTALRVEPLQEQQFRHLPQIEEIINEGGLSARVKEQSIETFRRLARAEARVHGVAPEKIHFHEVGALDTIVDICGFFWSLEQLSVEKVLASPLPIGRGWVNCSHGPLPLPAPATMQLLAERKVPLVPSPVEKELVTPTGAALLCSAAESFDDFPSFTVEKIGCGAGSADLPFPNLLRAHLGSIQDQKDSLASSRMEKNLLLEANIDDLNPETYDYIMELLFDRGARDVFLTPIQMKKNRPAVKLSALIKHEQLEEITAIIFAETSTIGLRAIELDKIMLPRKVIAVQTSWGPVRVKVAGNKPPYFNLAPEYEDCRVIAKKEGIPLKEVYRRVEYACREQLE
ncbi:MAG: nickel pincer cofactor biosynthesis protein LarC [Firmicutes bacterium]|nr:nickel pincer cofactor biosynthesis protein LarC [Bacillota bacterium]